MMTTSCSGAKVRRSGRLVIVRGLHEVALEADRVERFPQGGDDVAV
jgi:hypothetical protein